MLDTINPEVMGVLKNFIRVARVIEVTDCHRIKLSLDEQNIEFYASFAMGNQPLPVCGDSVIVVGEDLQTSYIIGHISSSPQSQFHLNIDTDRASGKSVLTVPEGDLELVSAKGCIRLRAGKEIDMVSQNLQVKASKADINFIDSQFQGMRLSASIAQAKMFLGKLQITAGRLIEKAKNVYRQIENLNQLKAGRMRTLVNGSYHLKSDTINQKADGEVRIDGDKINLG